MFGRILRHTLLASVWLLVGCHGLLDVTNPTLIRDQDIANAAGANARRLSAVLIFSQIYPSTATEVGFFTDERSIDYDYRQHSVGDWGLLDLRDS